MTDAADTLIGSGLSGLRGALPEAKALLARRLVAAGRLPTPFDFDKQGLRLAPDEQVVLQRWLDAIAARPAAQRGILVPVTEATAESVTATGRSLLV